MIEKTVRVELETGLQARVAAQFVQEAHRFSSDIFLEKDGKKVNAKSIMGLMSLAIASEESVGFVIEGPDEEEAMEHLVSFVTTAT